MLGSLCLCSYAALQQYYSISQEHGLFLMAELLDALSLYQKIIFPKIINTFMLKIFLFQLSYSTQMYVIFCV